MEKTELAIVGSGPAGITAGIYAARKNLKVRVFESEGIGGQAAEAIWVENWPGDKKIKGEELTERMREHLKDYGISVEQGNRVEEIRKEGNEFVLKTKKSGEVKAKAVVLATGSEKKKLGVKGEEEFNGMGVSYCATCDALFFKGKKVVVVGAGNSGANAALYIQEIAESVEIVEFLEKSKADEVIMSRVKEAGIPMHLNSEVTEIVGEGKLEAVKIKERKTGKEQEIKADGVFVYIGLTPRAELAQQTGAELDEKGYMKVDSGMMSSVPGLFAAGDLNGGTAQVVVAAGSGCVAALSAYDYIRTGQKKA